MKLQLVSYRARTEVSRWMSTSLNHTKWECNIMWFHSRVPQKDALQGGRVVEAASRRGVRKLVAQKESRIASDWCRSRRTSRRQEAWKPRHEAVESLQSARASAKALARVQSSGPDAWLLRTTSRRMSQCRSPGSRSREQCRKDMSHDRPQRRPRLPLLSRQLSLVHGPADLPLRRTVDRRGDRRGASGRPGARRPCRRRSRLVRGVDPHG